MRARDMIRARAKREPALYDALYEECQDALREGKSEVAEHILREYLELPDAAVEKCLEDFGFLSVVVERLRDPADPVLDWNEVRRELLGSD